MGQKGQIGSLIRATDPDVKPQVMNNQPPTFEPFGVAYGGYRIRTKSRRLNDLQFSCFIPSKKHGRIEDTVCRSFLHSRFGSP